MYLKILNSLNFFHRSFGKTDDRGRLIVNLAVAFEVLLTDSYAPGVGRRMSERIGKLLGGEDVKKYDSIIKLYEKRNVYVHSGVAGGEFDMGLAQDAYVRVFLKIIAKIDNVSGKDGKPIKQLVGL